MDAGAAERDGQRVDLFAGRRLGAVQHIGATPDLAGDEAALVHQRIGAADRADRHADIIGEVALRRQFAAGGQGAA